MEPIKDINTKSNNPFPNVASKNTPLKYLTPSI